MIDARRVCSDLLFSMDSPGPIWVWATFACAALSDVFVINAVAQTLPGKLPCPSGLPKEKRLRVELD
jgi:hypothetical protein